MSEWPYGEGRRGASPPPPRRGGDLWGFAKSPLPSFLSSRYLDILPPLLFPASKDSLGIPQTSTDPRGIYKKVVEVAAGRKRKFQCQNLLLEPPSVFLLGLPSRPPPTYTPTLPRSSVCPRREGKDVNQSGHLPPNSPLPLPATYCAPYLPRLRLRRKWRMRRGEVTGEMNGGGRQRSSSSIICTPPPSCCETRRIFMEDVSAGK